MKPRYCIKRQYLGTQMWWDVYLGTEHVQSFGLKREAIDWIIEKEKQ